MRHYDKVARFDFGIPAPVCRGPGGLRAGPRPLPIPLQVVILYGDVRLGARALRLLADLADQLEVHVRFEPQLWQLGLMEKRAWRDAIAPELATADVVILAPCASGLTTSMEDWFVASIDRPGTDAPAVIALSAPEDGANPASWENLRRRIGIRFFVARATMAWGESPS